jgi:tRNA modification GTPase
MQDTITAIATPLGEGSIGVIRISGPKSLGILKRIFLGTKIIHHNYVYHGQIIDSESKQKIDDVCVIYFKGPNSYTGEDVVEIQGHSNIIVLQSILSMIVNHGARLADRGEFTKRAFVLGKLDLTQAEAVIDIIQAKSHKAASVALGHLQGNLFNHIKKIRKKLITLLENIEASIDFPEEVEAIDRSGQLKIITSTQKKVSEIIAIQDYGEMVNNGIKCVIIGKPNVGKSSVLNKLLGKSRAIVTSIPGTTRDFIDAQVEIGGQLFEFIDTAGFRETEDKIEKQGQKKIAALIKSAHLIFWVMDISQKIAKEDDYIYHKIKRKKNIYLIPNKIDKKHRLNIQEHPFLQKYPLFKISAKTGQGISLLKQKIHDDCINKYKDFNLDLICNLRQIHCIKDVNNHLITLKQVLKKEAEDDLLAIDLKAAIQGLGELSGEEISEKVLDGIFSRFCIGK